MGPREPLEQPAELGEVGARPFGLRRHGRERHEPDDVETREGSCLLDEGRRLLGCDPLAGAEEVDLHKATEPGAGAGSMTRDGLEAAPGLGRMHPGGVGRDEVRGTTLQLAEEFGPAEAIGAFPSPRTRST